MSLADDFIKLRLDFENARDDDEAQLCWDAMRATVEAMQSEPNDNSGDIAGCFLWAVFWIALAAVAITAIVHS